MRYSKLLIFLAGIFIVEMIYSQDDWKQFANFERYAMDNEKLPTKEADQTRVVFMGNSITQAWPVLSPAFFKSNSNFIGRGISGQTTPQMVLRFRADVIDLDPDVVVILAGTNDIAGNTGHASNESILANIKSMTEMARQNEIQVILCSVLPAIDFPWRPGQKPAERIRQVNELIEAYAQNQRLDYVNYYEVLVDDDGGLKVPDYTAADDLVHPNAAGYQQMEKVLMKVLGKYLN